MPYVSDQQRKYFNANRDELEAQGVDVSEWNKSSKGKKLPKRVRKKKASLEAIQALWQAINKGSETFTSACKRAAVEAVEAYRVRFCGDPPLDLSEIGTPDGVVSEVRAKLSCESIHSKVVENDAKLAVNQSTAKFAVDRSTADYQKLSVDRSTDNFLPVHIKLAMWRHRYLMKKLATASLQQRQPKMAQSFSGPPMQAMQTLMSMVKPHNPGPNLQALTAAPAQNPATPTVGTPAGGTSPAQNPINAYGPLNQAGTVGGGAFGQKMTEGGNLKLAAIAEARLEVKRLVNVARSGMLKRGASTCIPIHGTCKTTTKVERGRKQPTKKEAVIKYHVKERPSTHSKAARELPASAARRRYPNSQARRRSQGEAREEDKVSHALAKKATTRVSERVKHSGWQDVLKTIGNSSTLQYGLGGAGAGAAFGGLKHLIEGNESSGLWPNLGTGASVGGVLGAGYGGLRDFDRWYNTGLDYESMSRPRSGGLPNKKVQTSLADQIGHYYKGAPGGLDKAIEEAQKHIPKGKRMGLQSWDPERVKKLHDMLLVDRDALARIKGKPALGATFADPTINDFAPLLVAAPGHNVTPDVKDTIEHEMTHYGLQPNKNPLQSIGEGIRQPVVPWEKARQGSSSFILHPGNSFSHVPGMSEDYWNYAATPEEMKAFVAPIKREWVKQHGKHMTTPKDAEAALEWWFSDPGRIEGKSKLTSRLAEKLRKDPRSRSFLIQQLLQLVRSNAPQPNSGRKYASVLDKWADQGMLTESQGALPVEQQPMEQPPAQQAPNPTAQPQSMTGLQAQPGRNKADINRQLAQTPPITKAPNAQTITQTTGPMAY